MTSSVTDVVSSLTVPSVYFLTVDNLYKAPAKFLGSLFRDGPWTLRPHPGFATNHRSWFRHSVKITYA